jgi:dephospho-CoA kinase
MKPNESKKAKPEVWGLTGGIASGKSAVARFFAEAGVPVIDADQVARDLRAPGGAAFDPILKRFGTADSARLRGIVFADPQARADLEAILHPLIRDESARRIAAAIEGRTGVVPVIYEAALLVETGRYRDFKGLIVVSADEKLRMARLVARDGCTEGMAQKMIASQIEDAKRREAATYVIENHGSLDDLRAQVLSLLPKIGFSPSAIQL